VRYNISFKLLGCVVYQNFIIKLSCVNKASDFTLLVQWSRTGVSNLFRARATEWEYFMARVTW